MIYQTFNFFLYPINWSAKVDTCKNGQCMTEPIELYDLFTRAVWYEIRKEHSNVPIDGIKKLNCQRILWYNKLTTQFTCFYRQQEYVYSECRAINKLVSKSFSKSKCTKQYSNSKVIHNDLCVSCMCLQFVFSLLENGKVWQWIEIILSHMYAYTKKIAFYLNARLLEWTSEEKTTCVFLTVI